MAVDEGLLAQVILRLRGTQACGMAASAETAAARVAEDLRLLLEFAPYVGVGARTAFGCGNAQRA